MKKITAIIIGFVVVAFIVISTVGENKVDYSEMNVVTIEFTDQEEMWIPIEEWEHKDGCYDYCGEEGFTIICINECLVPENTEVIHLTDRD